MSALVFIPAHRPRSNHADIARAIGIDIISRRFEGGSKLPSDVELGSRFGVSRPVLRESVKTLVAKGLLTTKARIGTVVREPSAWNMFDPDVLAWHLDAGIDRRFLGDLADIRLAVEPHSAALAATRRDEDDLVRMHSALEALSASPGDSPAFADADLALHLAIATASRNPFMRSIGAVVEAALRASFQLSAPADEVERARAINAHARIVRAIADGDEKEASDAMSGVILNGIDRHGSVSPGRVPGAGLVPAKTRQKAVQD